jgi:hypothetical protein
MVFQAIPSKFSCATFQKHSNTSHFVQLFLAHEDVVDGFVIFHTKLSTPRLGSFICSSLILQGSWSDHCNLKKKRKRALLHGMWKLVGTRWNRLAMVWERKRWGGVLSYKRAPMCQINQTSQKCSHLYSTEDIKNSVASHWQKQPPLKITFTSVLQMKSSSTCLIPASLCEGPVFYFYFESTYFPLSQAGIWVVMFHSSICWSV